MQLRLCDMCKRNIVGKKYTRVFVDPKDSVFQTGFDLCNDCYKKFHDFMINSGVAEWIDKEEE